MVASTMMMIPGALEPRRAVVPMSPVAVINRLPADRLADASEPEVERRELAGWLKVSIFAATLLAAMWLTMVVF
jgi:hypothetical protein